MRRLRPRWFWLRLDFHDWLFLGLPFLSGVLAGVFLPLIFRGSILDVLPDYFAALTGYGVSLGRAPVPAACVSAFCAPALLLLSGVSALAPVLVPVVVFFEGLLLSFGVSACGLCCGTAGVLFCLVLTGLPALFFVPAVFLTGHVSLKTYSGIFGAEAPEKGDAETLSPYLLSAFFLTAAGLCVELFGLRPFWDEIVSIL